MAAHASILAWRISWTEEPDGPQSMGRKELIQLSDYHSGKKWQEKNTNINFFDYFF